MADCDWAILCDYAFQDVARKTCAIGIFDRIMAAGVPAQHHQAALIFRLIGEPNEKVKFRVDISRPTGGMIGSIGGEVTMPEAGMAEFIANLQGLPLPDFGVYAFALTLGEAAMPAKVVSLTVAPVVRASPKSGAGDKPAP